MNALRLCLKSICTVQWAAVTEAFLRKRPLFIRNQDKSLLVSYHTTGSSSEKHVSDPPQSTSVSDDPKKLLDDATSQEEDRVDFPSDVHENQKSDMTQKRSQKKHAFRPKIDPKETTILLFPGQGSQFVGMGKQLLDTPGVDELYSMASEILGYDLLDLCLNGPTEKLNQTVHCQPAVFVTSMAAVEKLKQTCPWAIEHCITAAGFSVGEYAALVFSGAIRYEDAVQVIKTRAEAMHEASLTTPSGMTTVFLTHKSKLKYACHTAKQYCAKVLNMENSVCSIANYLYPECKVVAGNNEALDFLEKHSKEFGIPRMRRLPVSGAFHTYLMRSADGRLREALKQIDIETPIIPVHSNVTGYKYKHPKFIEKLLIRQISEPVRWEQIMHILYTRPEGEDFPFTYEVGPGTQLGQILSRTNRKAHAQYEALPV